MDWQNFYVENPRNNKGFTKRKVYGKGVNDLGYVTTIKHGDKIVYRCEFYSRWEKMLRRCYSKQQSANHSSYSDVSVADDFLSASFFKDWTTSQVHKESGIVLDLDKDILDPSAKLYSPETCVYVPNWLNYALYTGSNIKRDDQTLGVIVVTLNDGTPRYVARSATKEHLGTFDTEILAHKAWQMSKIERLESLIIKYRELKCYRIDVDEAITRRIEMIHNQIKNETKTVNLDF